MRRLFLRSIVTLVLLPLLLPAADAPPGQDRFSGLIEEPSIAMQKFQVTAGLQVDLFAAEPMVQNPVSFCFDDQGRVYLVESFRRRTSVFDIRGHRPWLETDFSFRTVEDRAEFFRQTILPTNESDIRRLTGSNRGGYKDFNDDGVIDWRDLQVETERIRLLEDTDGDGLADRVEVYAEGFTNIVAGVAAGILAHSGEIYFTCIPDLWRLRDADGDGKADQREALLHGFGVHIAFGGHDMHGIIMGPDGKLYWSIADRGTSTNLWDRIIHKPAGLTPELLADTGCVFRGNPDGTGLEVVAWGLRNPQELAFDDFGNLFTADNNGDGGDPARWHLIVEGADYGWRLGWQWLPKMGAWNDEKLWALPEESTAAYLLPPLAHIGHGPSGLAYYPGTGLNDRFRHHFFLCDFPGGVLMWTNRAKGASFEIGPVAKFMGDLGPTDIAFAPGGGAYVSDWFKTFEKTDRGRIYRIHDPAMAHDPIFQQTKSLLASDVTGVPISNLVHRLSHVDRRVRSKAQFELVRRGAVYVLNQVAVRHPSHSEPTKVEARLHAVWGLGQIADPTYAWFTNDSSPARFLQQAYRRVAIASLRNLTGSDSDEVQAAALQALAHVHPEEPAATFLPALSDENPHVAMTAALGLSRLKQAAPATTLLTLAEETSASDAYVRHAIVMALSRAEQREALRQNAEHEKSPIRMACLLALRRLGDPSVATFLEDSEPSIVLEAARAINDHPIPGGFDALAALLDPGPEEAPDSSTLAVGAESNGDAETFRRWTLRRALNANFRLGHAQAAQRLAQFARQDKHAVSLRVEALEMLSEWTRPPTRDKIVGLYRPVSPLTRDSIPARNALRPVLPALLFETNAVVRRAATRAAEALELPLPDAMDTLTNRQLPPDLRLSALRSLLQATNEVSAKALQLALNDGETALREAGLRWQTKHQPTAGMTALRKALDEGEISEQQTALDLLATMETEEADELILDWLDRLMTGSVPESLRLDVLQAAEKRSTDKFSAMLKAYDASLAPQDPLRGYRVALHGGNAERGRVLFYERQEAGCFRCHKINGQGGEVGPDLTGIGQRQSREYLLESIVTPNQVIAPGYETSLLVTHSGTTYAGRITRETDQILEVESLEDGLVRLPKSDIKARSTGLSAMPPELATLLTKAELRDLIEFLAQLR